LRFGADAGVYGLRHDEMFRRGTNRPEILGRHFVVSDDRRTEHGEK